ncbi:MAG: GNAT family N-acetyltransferase [Bacteroidota bacterium]
MINIIDAYTENHIPEIRNLFLEYAASLNIDLCFQNFDKELAGLPGDYAPPGGCLLMIIDGEKTAGCVAIRKISDEICEMKRLYIKPEFRGKGLGKKLAVTVIERAKNLRYHTMRLDTLPIMKEAIQMYRSLGFREISPYRFNPVEGAIYMELELKGG